MCRGSAFSGWSARESSWRRGYLEKGDGGRDRERDKRGGEERREGGRLAFWKAKRAGVAEGKGGEESLNSVKGRGACSLPGHKSSTGARLLTVRVMSPGGWCVVIMGEPLFSLWVLVAACAGVGV